MSTLDINCLMFHISEQSLHLLFQSGLYGWWLQTAGFTLCDLSALVLIYRAMCVSHGEVLYSVIVHIFYSSINKKL